MGKKYIIELEDEPLVYNETTEKEELWRVKGFKSLVFDNFGLEKLTPYEIEHMKPLDNTPSDAYNQGLVDGWQTLLEINKLSALDRNQLFGRGNFWDAIGTTTPQEAINKLEEYNKKNKKPHLDLKIGDEVEWLTEGENGVVISVDNEHFSVLYQCGDAYWFSFSEDIDLFKLTGRRFPQMAEIMNAIGEDENDSDNNCWK